jgi:putative transposase
VVKAQICWKNVGVALIRKWRLRHRPVTGCLEEAGDRLFTFTRLPRSQWRGARTTNAIKFARRVQAPDSKRGPYCRLQILRRCCSGRCQINMRKIDGWRTLARKSIDQPIDLAA